MRYWIFLSALCTVASAAPPQNLKPVRVYERGTLKVEEYRGNIGIEKVEVRSGPGKYTVREQHKPWQDEQESQGTPMFQLFKW